MRIRAKLCALLAAVFIATLAFGAPAAVAAPTDKPVVEPLTITADVDVELIDERTGRVIKTAHLGMETMNVEQAPLNAEPRRKGQQLSTEASAVEGASSASGCQRVTVHNVARTGLGFVAYKFHSWTYWCWNRASAQVYNVDTTPGWYITDVDGQFYWRGIVNSQCEFFAWIGGYPRSGYIHMEQGQFDNCILKYGCIMTNYPTNRLRSRSDGTWYWATEG